MTVTGDAKDLERFRLQACGHTHNYNEYRNNTWEAFDDIRLKSILETPPDSGEPSDLSFHRLCPVPTEVMCLPYDTGQAEKLLKRLGLETSEIICGYEWESDNWGCKWGSTGVCTHHSDEYLQYSFETAWAPPLPLLHKVAKDFPELGFTLSYEEPGMAFEGEAHWEQGECAEDRCWEFEEEDSEE
jgi:hypothetical protein